MKNLKKFSAMLIAVMLIAFSCVTALGTTVNDTSVEVGDSVTYTLNLSDVPSPVAGIQLSIFYDSNYLEPDTDTISCNGFPGSLVNTNNSGEIIMNATNGVDGFDFKSKNEIISVTFKVLKDGDTDITYFIYDLYDIYEYGPGDYLKTYTLTSDLSVNGNNVSTDVPPALDPDKAENGNTVGDFVNNEEGRGEVSPEDATPPSTDNSENLTQNQQSDPAAELIDDTGSDNKEPDKNGSKSVLIISIVVIIIIAVIAVAAVIAVKRKKAGKDGKN